MPLKRLEIHAITRALLVFFPGQTGTQGAISQIPALVLELARRGYNEENLEKVLGEIVLRVVRLLKQVARQMQAAR